MRSKARLSIAGESDDSPVSNHELSYDRAGYNYFIILFLSRC